jgi:hypothetical protein
MMVGWVLLGVKRGIKRNKRKKCRGVQRLETTRCYFICHGWWNKLRRRLELHTTILTAQQDDLHLVQRFTVDMIKRILPLMEESQIDHIQETGCDRYTESVTMLGWRSAGHAEDVRQSVLEAIAYNGYALQWAPCELQDDEELVLAALRSCGRALRHASPRLRDAESIVQAAIQENGFAIEFASERLKGDESFCLKVLRHSRHSPALQYVSSALLARKAFAVYAGTLNEHVLRYLSPELQDDKDVVLACVSLNGNNLRWASHRLKASRDIVVQSIKQNWLALSWASPELQADKQVVLEALHISGYALRFASSNLRKDKDCAMAATAMFGWCLEYSDLRDDIDVVKCAISTAGTALCYASPRLKGNQELVKAACDNNGSALCYASTYLQSQRDVIITAVAQSRQALEYALGAWSDGKLLRSSVLEQCRSHAALGAFLGGLDCKKSAVALLLPILQTDPATAASTRTTVKEYLGISDEGSVPLRTLQTAARKLGSAD